MSPGPHAGMARGPESVLPWRSAAIPATGTIAHWIDQGGCYDPWPFDREAEPRSSLAHGRTVREELASMGLRLEETDDQVRQINDRNLALLHAARERWARVTT